jgi:flagellar hook assembly protein FlgD
MAVSKVKTVTANGIFKSSFGVDIDGVKGFYKFEYEFEDGQVLSAKHKTKEPFKVGDDVEYEVKGTNDYGSWGKVGKPEIQASNNNSNKEGYTKGIEVGHAVNNAVNLICAGATFLDIEPSENTEEMIKLYAKKILGIANNLKAEV